MVRMAPGFLVQQAREMARQTNLTSAENKVWNETQRGLDMSPALRRIVICAGDAPGWTMRRSMVTDCENTEHGRFQCTVTSTITIHKF